jgi:putative signal transducing protein
MSSIRDDFALLLAAPDPVEADLARNLLDSAGIPSLLQGQDRDIAELGASSHSTISRPDLYVPKSAVERARAVLREAWGEERMPS